MMNAENQDFVLLNDADIAGYNEKGLLPLSAEEIANVQKWLEPTDYSAISSEYGKHSCSHLAGTGEWILRTAEYQQWHDLDRGALWIKAVAGAGKSVVAASLAKKLMTEETAPVLYFFFRHIVSANQKPQSLVRDFMSQVLDQSVQLQHELHSFVKDRRTLDSVSLHQMWKLVLSALSSLPRAYCVIDALDEMDTDSGMFFENLVELGQLKPRSIKVLMTSRPIPRVERVLRDPSVLQILLQSRLVNPDISRYIKHRLDEFNVAEAVSMRIHDTMATRADGHFLYARLMMDNLFELAKDSSYDQEKIFSALDGLPTPMADMYTKMLQDHSRRSGVPEDLQIALLQWVTRAERPVRLLELSHMINVHRVAHELAIDDKAVVREGCGPLLEILEDETVCPIHHSFTEYLYDLDRNEATAQSGSYPVLDEKSAQSALTAACISQLMSGWHHSWPDTSPDDRKRNVRSKLREMKLTYPCLNYAIHHWHTHLHKAGLQDEDMISKLDKLLLKDPHLLLAILEAGERPEWFLEFGNPKLVASRTAMHEAACKGLTFYVEHLVNQGLDFNYADTRGHTPLALAARAGYAETVKALLRFGANATKDDGHGLTALHHAAMRDHHQVVKVLLAAGVDPMSPKTKENPGQWCGNSPATRGQTGLQYACERGHVDSVREFIPYLNPKDLNRGLCWALSHNRNRAVQTLLQAPGICLNSNDVHCRSPLRIACRTRNAEMIRLLLEMGADPHAPVVDSIGFGRFALNGADVDCYGSLLDAVIVGGLDNSYGENAIASVLKCLALLLDAGVDLNMVDTGGSTVLRTILEHGGQFGYGNSRSGTEELLSMLLSRGLLLGSLGPDGGNAFHNASSLSLETAKLLKDNGVDINHIRKSDGFTPIMCALKRNDTFSASTLLACGADTGLVDGTGNTPLHLVAKSNCQQNFDLIDALLVAGADVNARNTNGDTPMHICRFLEQGLLHRFLKHGYDLEAKSDSGQTVLFKCLINSSVSAIRNNYSMLVDAGADPLTCDARGWTVLHCLFSQKFDDPHCGMARYFVEKGVDPCAVDSFGNTLWHVLAERGDCSNRVNAMAAMDFLSQHGVSPSTRNNSGQLPIHVACCEKSFRDVLDTVELLHKKNIAPLDAIDNHRIRPLHLAASFSPELTYQFLERGADLTALTIQGQSALIVACRNRQPNIVGILLDCYKENGQVELLDQIDEFGRIALHYACQSGVPETVELLLEAGISANVKDKRGLTPLAACAEYLDEQPVRTTAISPLDCNVPNRTGRSSNVLIHENSRLSCHNKDETPIRIQETVRLLIHYGADVSFLTQPPFGDANMFHPGTDFTFLPIGEPIITNPLVIAVRKGCYAMTNVLLVTQDQLFQDKASNEDVRKQWEIFMHNSEAAVMLLRVQHEPAFIEQNLAMNDDNRKLVEELLKADNEQGIQLIEKLAPDVLCKEYPSHQPHPITRLVSWGFSDLLRTLVHVTAQTAVERIEDKTLPVIDWGQDALKDVLKTSLQRTYPNQKTVKVLIEDVGLDPHELFPGPYATKWSVLHMLAAPTSWWQIRALEYFVDRGVNIELRDTRMQTPLFTALQEQCPIFYEPLRLRAVTMLLSRGADPNAADECGRTCLNAAAARHPQYTKLLLNFGANPLTGFPPLIFDAIELQDMDLLQTIINAKVDVNVTATKTPTTADPHNHKPILSKPIPNKSYRKVYTFDYQVDDLLEWAYPIHVAASCGFNVPTRRQKAIEMINLLLEAGADPNLTYGDENISILHKLAESSGILEPFLKHASCDLEARDRHGRTILLAACSSRANLRSQNFVQDQFELLLNHGASIEVRDREGCNLAHYIIRNWPNPSLLILIPAKALSSLLSQKNNEGRTPFHYVLSKRSLQLIDTCLDHGVDATIPDPFDGSTALHHIATKLTDFWRPRTNSTEISIWEAKISELKLSREEAVTYLVNREALLEEDQDAKNNDELQYSARRHFKTMLKLGIDINAPDHNGNTPLHWLVSYQVSVEGEYWFSLYQILKLLAEQHSINESAKVDFTARNSSGQSALHKIAGQCSDPTDLEQDPDEVSPLTKDLQASFKLLVEMGADVTWEDDQSRTCLDVAAACGSDWLLELFKRK